MSVSLAMDAQDETILKATPSAADERIAYGAGPLQYADLRLPVGRGPHPVVVVVHGGRWKAEYDLQHTSLACTALTKRGVATWNLEYRRLGHADGGYPATLLDVGEATDVLRQVAPAHNLDLRRVVVAGHSSGGHLALWLAARHRIPPGDALHARDPLRPRAAVALAGIPDLIALWEGERREHTERFLGGPPQRYPERYHGASPTALLPFGVPQVLMHGDLDEQVPLSYSTRYAQRASALGDDARAVPLHGAGHFWLIDPRSPAWPAVEATIVALAVGSTSEPASSTSPAATPEPAGELGETA
jgi:acetyl esterase/lipase